METTINMNYENYKLLDSLSKKYNISKNRIIKIVLKEFEVDSERIKLFYTVKYQEKNNFSFWKKFHLVLTPSEYELFTDLRNFFKMSLSLIVALAIDRYLCKIFNMKNNNKFTDTYPDILFPAYCIIYTFKDNLKSYAIYWGVPETIPKL